MGNLSDWHAAHAAEKDKKWPPKYQLGEVVGAFQVIEPPWRDVNGTRQYLVKCNTCSARYQKSEKTLARAARAGYKLCGRCSPVIAASRGLAKLNNGEVLLRSRSLPRYEVGQEVGIYTVVEITKERTEPKPLEKGCLTVIVRASVRFVYRVKCGVCGTESMKTSPVLSDIERRGYVYCGSCFKIVGRDTVNRLLSNRAKLATIKAESLDPDLLEEDEREDIVKKMLPQTHSALQEFDPEVLKLGLSGRWGVEPPITLGIRCWYERREGSGV